MNPVKSQTQDVAAKLTRQARAMRAGDELGTVSSVAAEYEVSKDVARNALALLVRHGLARAEARRHVVEDPEARAGLGEDVEDLRRRVATLEQELAEAREAGAHTQEQVGILTAQLVELYARTGQPWPGTESKAPAKRRRTG